VLVVHENRGLNPHIEDIARRLALANFIAFAPDALFPLGGYPGDEDKARTVFQTLDQAKTSEDFVAAAGKLEKIEGGNGRLGVVGFCYGGGWRTSSRPACPSFAPRSVLRRAARARRRPKIKAELLLNFAENDERINGMWPTTRPS
jgi:carboxymethylenebutenolidase